MRKWRATVVASGLVAATSGACTPAAVQPPEPDPAPAPALPTWCDAVDDAIGRLSSARGFECLEVPNFLVTGFYGTADNPERSDFVNGCFAGDEAAAERLKMSVRPAGDLALSYRTERKLAASGSLDLGFLGPWAPRLDVTAPAVDTVEVSVELADAEVRVLSSVAEILGQEFRSAARDASSNVAPALEACLESLCDASGPELVYTAKVLAAVPVVTVSVSSADAKTARLSLGAGVAGFEVNRESESERRFQLRARDKLNIAARLEAARPALDQARTCETVSETRARKTVVTGLRELGLQTLAGRDPESIADRSAGLRRVVTGTPGAFTGHEQQDLLHTIEALEAASRELSLGPPTRALCDTLVMLEDLLRGNGDGNRLHDLLTSVAEPLHGRLRALANDHALPCADPPFYQDADGDGYGDPKQMKRASKAPDGYVINSLDCYDHNPDARPGQEKYFTQARGDESYDYDCDGQATARTEVVAGGCKEITRFGIPIRCWAEPGWQERSPQCGQQGRWFAVCEEGMLSCDAGPTETRRQECR